MKKKRYLILLAYLVITIATAVFLVVRASGKFPIGFWLILAVDLVILALVYMFAKYRGKNEIVKCSSCGRTMTYEVFRRVGNCPKCHSGQFVRTGTWPTGQ
jgi:hypothetical protein